jgi:hypothetical protein
MKDTSLQYRYHKMDNKMDNDYIKIVETESLRRQQFQIENIIQINMTKLYALSGKETVEDLFDRTMKVLNKIRERKEDDD